MPASLFDDEEDGEDTEEEDEGEEGDEDGDEDENDEEEEGRPIKDVNPSPSVSGTPGVEPQGKQGVFADRESVFDTQRKVDHRNPVVTRAEELSNQLMPMRRPVTTKAQLVAIFDAQGRPFVAYHQNGRALEKFRLPTPQEFEVLRARGQLVKGGLGDAAPSPGTTPPPEQPKNRTWLWIGAAAVGVGAAAWWYMKKQKDKEKPRRNRRVRDADEMDDFDDEE